MFNIRLHTYETNSSSAHTLVLSKGEKFLTPKEALLQLPRGKKHKKTKNSRKYYINIDDITFGSNFNIINGWYEKLCYIVGAFSYDTGYIISISNAIKKYLPDCIGININMSYNEEDLYTIYDYTNDINCVGYDDFILLDYLPQIDHQSLDVGPAAIQLIQEKFNGDIEKAIIELVFNEKYVFITDTDCSETIIDLIKAGVLDSDMCSNILYFERIDGHAKFISIEEYRNKLEEFSKKRKERFNDYNKI